MVIHQTISQQRRGSKYLAAKGYLCEGCVLEFLCCQLGDLDAIVRSETIQLLSSCRPEEVPSVVFCVRPAVNHKHWRVCVDALLVIESCTEIWKEAYSDIWSREIVSTQHVVVPDGGGKFSSIVPKYSSAEEVIVTEKVCTTEPPTSIIRIALIQIVEMMILDWRKEVRDVAASIVAHLDLLPLLMVHVSKMLKSKDMIARKEGLRIIGHIHLITSNNLGPFCALFSDDFLSVRLEACKVL
jgi:hypothetical protein